MIYTVSNIESLVRSALNEPSTVIFTSADILRMINDAQLHCATRAFCIEKSTLLVTTPGSYLVRAPGAIVNYVELVGSASYGFYDDIFTDDEVTWHRTQTATNTSSFGLQQIIAENFGHKTVIPGDYTPQKWVNWGAYIIIDPVPDDGYILKTFYSDYPAELLNTTDVLEVPKEFQPAIIDFVLMLMCMKLKRWAEVGGHYNKYITTLQKATATFIEQSPDTRIVAKSAPNK
jgi:hypothetical protein